MMRLKRACHRANFCLRRIFEVAARAKDFEAFEPSAGNLPEKFWSQFPGYKQIGRE
jgi:hypothetical protein